MLKIEDLLKLKCMIAMLMFVVVIPISRADNLLSQNVFAIFQQNCLVCHGVDGAFQETLLMEHSELIDSGSVIPENADGSELYKRLLGPTENGMQMPLGQPQLSTEAIESIKQWIQAGASDWNVILQANKHFIAYADILKNIEAHLNSIPVFDRPFARYFTFAHLYNSGAPVDILKEYRKALNNALFFLPKYRCSTQLKTIA